MSLAFDDIIDNSPNGNLILIDSLNMAFRWKKQGTGWAQSLNNTIESLANSYGAVDTIVTGDGGSVYRKRLYPDYKGNRNKEDQTEKEKKEWSDFFDEYEESLKYLSSILLRFKGLEADDIIAYLTLELAKYYNHIWIVSSDRDLDLLITDKVSRFSLFSKKEFTKDNFEEHYGYPLNMHLDVKVLNGDTGDNITGIPGVGPKRAFDLLQRCGGSAYDVMDALPLNGTAKYIQELNKFDGFYLNHELMDLVSYSKQAISEAGCLKEIDNKIEEIKNEIQARK